MKFDKNFTNAVNDNYTMTWFQLHNWLKSKGKDFTLNPLPQRFMSGMGNLNYKITLDGTPVVLRRPPLGPIPPGANDMNREYTLLKSLAPFWNLIPKPICFCNNPEIFGAPFLIMEYKRGTCILGDNIPKEWKKNIKVSELSSILIKLLSKLHSINPKTVGLEKFGNPKGFLTRQLNGWQKRCLIATDNNPPKSSRSLYSALTSTYSLENDNHCIIHNDFKLDNILLIKSNNSDKLKATAIIDWDQATIGNPLYDLATLLTYWIESKDPPELQLLKQMPTTMDSFPTRSDAIELYKKSTGSSLHGFRWIYSLAMYKLGVVFLQLYAQYIRGSVSNNKFSEFGNISNAVFEKGLDVLLNKSKI